MQIAICITTINRSAALKICLQALCDSKVKPHKIIVSDDSPKQSLQEQNRHLVEQYPCATYIFGPGIGVCGNRNNAVNSITKTDLVAFVDDDVCLDPNFIELAIDRYSKMSLQQREKTIISGVTCNQYGNETEAVKLSWNGYFCASNDPQAINIHAAVFPWSFFKEEQWDENIYFGYEDAELCLRALKRGYRILHCPELRAYHTQFGKGTLMVKGTSSLTDYEINIEAARLYVGIKRYKDIFPNPLMLVAFLSFYCSHMTMYLLKHRALDAWPQILYRSNIKQLWKISRYKSHGQL